MGASFIAHPILGVPHDRGAVCSGSSNSHWPRDFLKRFPPAAKRRKVQGTPVRQLRPRSASLGWDSRRDRWTRSQTVEPFAKSRVPLAPSEIAIARLEPKRADQHDLRQIEITLHRGAIDFRFP